MWLESLRTLALLVNQPLFPCAESNWVRALQKILPIDHGSGLAQRPQLLRPTQTYVTVQNAILSTCRPGRFGGVGVPDIPILQPEVLIEMPKKKNQILLQVLGSEPGKRGINPTLHLEMELLHKQPDLRACLQTGYASPAGTA